jgi:hypothetical protein
VISITDASYMGHWLAKLYRRDWINVMNAFGVLTNRKRALIALIHSVVFLGIAVHGFASPKGGILHGYCETADLVLLVIYLLVASILAWLVSISRSLLERVYFTLCTCSASFGLLRVGFGDASLPAAQYLRVMMLVSAVSVGAIFVRSFSRLVSEPAMSE